MGDAILSAQCSGTVERMARDVLSADGSGLLGGQLRVDLRRSPTVCLVLHVVGVGAFDQVIVLNARRVVTGVSHVDTLQRRKLNTHLLGVGYTVRKERSNCAVAIRTNASGV